MTLSKSLNLSNPAESVITIIFSKYYLLRWVRPVCVPSFSEVDTEAWREAVASPKAHRFSAVGPESEPEVSPVRLPHISHP